MDLVAALDVTERRAFTMALAWSRWMSVFPGMIDLAQGSANLNVKRAILAPFLLNKIRMEPQNIWCPNKDSTAYS